MVIHEEEAILLSVTAFVNDSSVIPEVNYLKNTSGTH